MEGQKGTRMTGSLVFGLLLTVTFGVALHGLRPSAAHAQGGILTARIYGIDVTQFPTVTAFLQVVDLNAGLPVPQQPKLVAMIEDGQALPAQEATLAPSQLGSDIVILLDASQSIISPQSRGYTRKSRLEEARELVRAIVDNMGERSRVALLAPIGAELVFIGGLGKDGTPLTTNGGAVANALDQQDFPPRPRGQEATPLFDLLGRAIEVLQNAPGRANRPGMVIVLSDGIDFLSDQQVTDVTRRAQERQIVVHAIQIGPPQGKGRERAMENLRRIAAQTGGQVKIYGRDDMTPFYESLKTRWGQLLVLRYRSQVRQSGQHELVLRLEVGGQTIEVRATYALTIRPPEVRVEWEGGEEIDASKVLSLPVKIRVEWKDQRGAYGVLVKGFRVGEAFVGFEQQTAAQKGNLALLQGTVNLAGAPPGVYLLQVDLEDNLGFLVHGNGPRIRRPAAAPSPVSRGFLDVLPVFSCTLALAALGVAIIAFVRSPRLREAASTMTQPLVQRIKEVTEPFFPTGAVRGAEPARAWLVVVEGEEERRQIPIRSIHVRLGRDESLANIVFNDRTVSRLHCRIEEVEEGVFMIYDEGSTSGTYVNYEQVPMNGARLQDGDLINMGRVQLHFRLKLDAQASSAPRPAPSSPSLAAQEGVEEEKTHPLRLDDERTQIFKE
ncbi:FHA domain-containing protein [Thermoflexus sp.]|uniref:FHA domain-containing protein n=1 Tax=Thermoflexus sp. TaxID=1969742 RepID=UPI0025FACE0A|nr:FHA domain-containing protein [Thermoflexus sp.]MDW8180472.1 FHA domain-containing protein [Anaerolineae bacterium]MCS6963660.1 FHA domain-containing protein [Thermoflexus sp.]MCS7351019.1 FHA domain-containing protein [Thermoflexus sp.]MCX7691244.1 FHA domain-containing protein [Thermoflexus sp.]MDW8186006.1 FHA domain-containing protein [Anaerolineae bacterium]